MHSHQGQRSMSYITSSLRFTTICTEFPQVLDNVTGEGVVVVEHKDLAESFRHTKK